MTRVSEKIFAHSSSRLVRDLSDIQKSTKAIKRDIPQILPESYQHDLTDQHEAINSPDTLSLENMLTDPT